MFTWVKPAESSSGSWRDKVKPFVVTPTERIVGRDEIEFMMEDILG